MHQLALRFDVDSVRCWEEGVPNLLQLAEDADARFTFFVNMGVSFNWRFQIAHWMRRGRSDKNQPTVEDPGRCSLPTLSKLGLWSAIRTMAVNPRLGDRYQATVDRTAAAGHELGLHGGSDHVIWQRCLGDLDDSELRSLLLPALESFRKRYGQPAGFASPGFVFDDRVLTLLDECEFTYASDMPGTEPFQAVGTDGAQFRHHQIPVTIAGPCNVPIIETLLCRGIPHAQIVDEVVSLVRSKGSGVLYGHPYVEGVHIGVLRDVLEELSPDYDFVTVLKFFQSWLNARTDPEDADG